MRIIVTVLLLVLTAAPSTSAAQSVDQLEKAIQLTMDKSERARLYKELGDQNVAQDKLDRAAAAFGHALSHDRGRFSVGERVQMAVYLSWADRLSPSIRELKLVLEQEPRNLEARTHLARVLSWAGELSEAIAQADRVLKEFPENREALLVKADALRWKDQIKEAITIYRTLIERDGDFDAQVGLAHSMLALGNRTAAVETAQALKPANFPQEREFNKLIETIERATNPRIDTRYLYYKDSDRNRVDKYLLSFGFWVANWNLETSFRHTDARDKTRDNRAEDLSFKLYTNLTETAGVGAGLGLNQLGDGKTTNFPTGHFRIDARILNGTIGANFKREVLSDTAQLIENRIRATNAGLNISQALTDRLSLKAEYAFKHFSDRNRANDFQLNTEYALYFDPKIVLGHRFRFLDFRRQSGTGLFDPDDYFSNRVFGSFYIQRQKFYAYAEAFIGQQSFRRNGVPTDDFINGGAASFGLTPTRNFLIELYAEGGNFAAGTASGFRYFTVGPRLIFRF